MTDTSNESSGLWLTVSDLATERGIDKSTVSRRVTQLEADGLIETRKGARGTKLVNLAAYDRATGETVDAIRTAALKGNAPRGAVSKVLAHEQARRVAYQADLAQLDLDERLGKLVKVDEVVAAVATCAETILLTIEQLPSRAEEIAAAVGREGPHGARATLKAFTFEIRKTIERAMADLDAKGLSASSVIAGAGV